MNTESPMPAAPEVERAILAKLVAMPAHYWPLAIEGELTAEFFTDEHALAVWEIAAQIRRDGGTPDVPTVMAEIRNTGKTTLPKFSEILAAETSNDTWAQHLGILRDRLARRITLRACQSPETGEAALSTLSEAKDRVAGILSPANMIQGAREAAKAFVDHFQALNAVRGMPGLKTTSPKIDEATGGMKAGELWVVAGKSSSGKTALMLQMADANILEGKSALIFSLEMQTEELIGRIIARRSGVGMDKITSPCLAAKVDLEKIRYHVIELQRQKFAICDDGGQTIDKICGLAERYNETVGADLIVVDYVQLVEVAKMRGQSREQEVAQITRRLKQLAKKLKVPVVAGSQLNEDGKTRESRAIEQDANVLLHVDTSLAGDEDGAVRVGKVEVWKNRNGKRGFENDARFIGLIQKFTFPQ